VLLKTFVFFFAILFVPYGCLLLVSIESRQTELYYIIIFGIVLQKKQKTRV